MWQLTALMTAMAVAVAALEVGRDPEYAVPTLVWVLLLPAFALAEVVVIHLPAQRSSHSHTLREIPAIVGLTFLVPQLYLTAYVLGAGVALVFWSRQRGLKLCFNLALFALEATLGSFAYLLVLDGGDPIDPRGWLAALAAVLITDLVSAAAVTAAISLTDGAFDPAVLKEALRSGLPAAVVNACVALLLVTLIVARPSALPLLAAVIVLLVLGYRVYVGLARGYARLQLLAQFVGSTGRTSELDDVVSSVLSEAARLLHASCAQLVTLPSVEAPARCVTWQAGRLTSEDLDLGAASRWWSKALEGESVLLTSAVGEAARQGTAGDHSRDGVAVPLREAEQVQGVLMVTDRTFEEETFGAEDLLVFETLAAHVSVALNKARLVARLRRVADERAHEALHDPLTGLLNRRGFTEALASAMRGGDSGAVLLLDLDHFKDVNDTLGRSAGDRLLKVSAQRLTDEGTGLVARLGGDEFAVLVEGIDAVAAVAYAENLHVLLSRPVPLLGVQLITSASIGVTEIASSGFSDEVLGHADVAMSAAKAARSGVEAYRPEYGHSTSRRLALAADLQVAMRERALELYYQPQAHAVSGEVTGFEALLRWQHSGYGWVPPPEIIAVAHRTGLTRELTYSILQQALQARTVWSAAGYDLDVSVNVTTADISDHEIVAHVKALLEATSTPPAALVIEITESDAMRDPERCLTVLRALEQSGVRLSIDDFGTGYSSLAYLDSLPVHEVKIDQSFIFRMEKEAADSTIVRATVTLAHDLGLRVVAEGVENDLAKALVADMGCDLYQGYGLARPMPEAEVLGWLARHEAHRETLQPHPSALEVRRAARG